MSIEYCDNCGHYYNQDYEAEHEDECKLESEEDENT